MNTIDRTLVQALQDGLPLASRPYQEIARRLGSSEAQIIDDVRRMVASGVVKRLGLVVRHRALGYVHNAMVVWDVDDDRVNDVGERMSSFTFVTLCYRRPRRLPRWPYNLFCMIHGRNRSSVLSQVRSLTRIAGLEHAPYEVLFSRRCFRQRGARYVTTARVGDDTTEIEAHP